MGTGLPIFPDLASSQDKNERNRCKNLAHGGASSTVRPDPLETARGDVIFRRRFSDEARHRRNLIVATVVCLTTLFPPAGMLALYGRFDNTISWFTHGELHDLKREHRVLLKQQLWAEAVLYPTLVIVLTVYYSVHG